MKKPHLAIVKRLNGKKRLIFGNHDIFEAKDYFEVGFQKVMGMRIMEDMIFTHVPIYSEGMERFKRNVHGHLHTKLVRKESSGQVDDRYLNICVEQVNYTPVSLDEIKAKLK
jgi:calcineurin-like phosphoesterase family protein